MPELTPDQWRNIRDAVLFVVGLIGVLHEAFFTSLDRPGLLVLFAGMMGLAVKLRNGNGGDGKERREEDRGND